MTEGRGTDALVEELMTGEAPDPELLVRYLDDPDSLDDAERAGLEAQLAASPRARAALRALERFDPAAFAAPAAAPAERAAQRAGLLERLRAWLASLAEVPLWVPVAAAAALALALWLGRGDAPGPGASAPIARGPQSPPAPDPGVAPPAVPGSALPDPVEPVPAPRDPPAPQPGPGATDPTGAAAGPGTDPAPTGPRPDPAGTLEPAPPPEAPDPEPGVEPAPAPAPIYVAMLEPAYAPSFELDARERRESYVRGAPGAGRLVALAPEHVARTAQASPTLLWWVERPQVGGEWWLVVSDPQAFEPLLRARIEAPTRPGLQSAALADLGVELAPGVNYQWSIAQRVDPADPSADRVAQAWIRRVPPPAGLAGTPEHERPAALAAAGLWYDALAEIAARHRARPGAPAPRDALARMLEAAGLGDLDPDAGR